MDEDWAIEALATIYWLPRQRWSGESIRFFLTDRGLPEPRHHNHWGMLIKMAIDIEYIIPTGLYEPMQAPGSHGRRTEIYMVPLVR